jgi:phytoene dehydrogenase-like protein
MPVEPSAAPPTLPDAAEVVVVGAGHNGLVCAAYLARAGLDVLVLEASPTYGGNTRTEPLTLPGFAHDSCSSAHVLIQGNPLIRDDELDLASRYGLTYLTTDPAVVMPLPDGDTLVMRPDLDATADELARFSAADARQLTAMIGEWHDGLAAAHGRWSSHLPPGDDETSRRYASLRARSAWDVVHERFEHPVVRDFVLWLAMATIPDPRRPGTGFLPSSITAGRLSFGWTTPVGGSQALPDALVRLLEDHGGRVVCSSPVAAVEADSEGVRRVRTADGRSVRATRAVVAGGHLQQLAGMLEGVEAPADLVRARDSWRPGLSVFAVHAALKDDLGFGSAGIRSTAAGLGTAAGFAAQVDAHERGEWSVDDAWLLVVDQTVVDPSRAPASGGATFKILTIAPYALADGRDWADAKHELGERLVASVASRARGLDEGDILSWRVESPVDVAAHNPHNLGGSCHGGEFWWPGADGGVVAGWPTYTTGVPGLYLTGATTHPGGSVSGRPGRNAARAVLSGLGLDSSKVMGPT